MLTPSIQQQLRLGVSIVVGTSDERCMPECTRAWGVRFHGNASLLSLFLNRNTSEKTLANLRGNSRIAVTFARPTNHSALQIKGTVTAIRDPLLPEDREAQANWGIDLMSEMIAVGISRESATSVVYEPLFAIDVEVNEIYTQTPGVHAGEKL